MRLLDDLQAGLDAIDAAHLRRVRRTAYSPTDRSQRISVPGGEPRDILGFCGNDYLGLAAHPALGEAVVEGIRQYGFGSGASSLVSGHSIAHARLEARMAALQAPHIPEADALEFCTGYMANLAVVSALAQSGGIQPAQDCTIFSDALNHASLIDGARLSRARVLVYPHADVAALEALLAASTSRNKLIVTDGVFSMDGDIAPLPELLALAERYDAWLIVDDAHGLGVLGENGAGVLSHFGLHSERLVYVGTFGKAAGGAGAAIVAHRMVIDWLVQRARTYIFTTATPPVIACAVEAALDVIASEEGAERRARLNRHIAVWSAHAQRLAARFGWQWMPSPTAIQPIVIGENAPALELAAALEREGIRIAAIRPPTVPAGTARLRITLSAAHTADDIERLAQALEAAGQSLHSPAKAA
ncbi:8-amino-7-oxononanoate synthase [Ralstonia insidiosa]|jgi:8-amino-7-oxononanoate synthase|uniref:8-amino-7-oxononanoate synthase n=1 Tax=Ralstonia TaxID=48736 RepID=UPI000664AEFF|nr:8-amino-7-oxononanoate synthase [Ralstonia insidiosa]KMW47764.1 8-amino-7-oxononanoate synthase [Ralstonia sp. MD27]MBX3770685.1 8-amino-7-oxononanoate synthase [Ralstonia pickettii]NOZ18216.1 8-amino-7-oxononanoate synthase [Betaproteobacteria bacterium]MBA9854847.1 8-amino-7-oxononanoate synthase [Ralstonia insidiosa]MBA9868662.1 8-amino-7-oxononanoate synthase [Ralstonia insidiosa]